MGMGGGAGWGRTGMRDYIGVGTRRGGAGRRGDDQRSEISIILAWGKDVD